VGDSNPQSDESNIDEGWDDEPETVPRPATAAPVPVVNAWGPVPASRPTASVISPGNTVSNAVGASVAPDVAQPPIVAPAPPPAPVERPAPKSEITPPSKTAKSGRGSKEARAAKVAKKAAKRAARQAERKARAKNNNKSAIRGALAAARGHKADPDAEPMTARAEARKTAFSSPSEIGRRAGTPQRPAKASASSSVRPSRGRWARSTPLLVLLAAVAVLAGLGWFLAGRH
jgi:hypothetical protein